MSLAMSRPVLPSLNAERLPSLSSIAMNTVALPPLSSLLNTTESSYTTQSEATANKALSPSSLPTSPTISTASSTDPFSHKITTKPEQTQQQTHAPLTAPAITMQTPIRLPSFDSLKFETSATAKPVIQHSKSFSGQTTVPSMASLTTPAQVASLPTPVSRQPVEKVKKESTEQASVVPLPLVADPQHSPLIEKRAFAFISHSPSTFPSHEPAIDNAQLARRKRRRTSPGELAILQTEFVKGQTPNRARRDEIATRVNMTEKAVQIWFQNRRQALRRQSTSEKEVHHLEPVYTPQVVPHQMIANASPYSQQPMVFTSPFPPQHHAPIIPIHTQQSSSPERIMASSPAHRVTSSSPSNTSTTNVMITPSRPPKVKKSSPNGSTMTFRLTNEKTTPGKIMTPLLQTARSRQKPTMKVNYQPTSSSPIDKENVSPQSSPVKSNQELGLQSPKRVPLGQLSFNMQGKPRDNEAVANLLNLKKGN